MLLCSLLASLLLPLPSWAGHYVVTYSYTFTPPSGAGNSATNTTTAPSFSSPQYYSGTMTLVVSPVATWTADGPGDTSQAPALVSYIEQGATSMSIFDIQHPATGVSVTSQTATDDLGDANLSPAAPQYGVHSAGYHAAGPVKAVPPLTHTLKASFIWTTSDGIAAAGGGTSYALYPVYISLGGTLTDSSGNPVLDSSGNQQVLTGQQITATVAGIPSGYKVTKYTWTQPSATCFKTYNDQAQSNPLVPLASTDLSQTDTTGNGISVAPLAFYDSAGETLSVSCNVPSLNWSTQIV